MKSFERVGNGHLFSDNGGFDQDIMERLAGNNDENFRVIEERFSVRLC